MYSMSDRIKQCPLAVRMCVLLRLWVEHTSEPFDIVPVLAKAPMKPDSMGLRFRV